MKKISLLFLLSSAILFSNAQFLKKAVTPSSSFADSLSKIVLDFKNNFSRIQSAALPAQPDVETYLSKVCLPMAVHCVIYRYHSVQDKTGSWQAIMYAGESFEEAMKVYKNTFKQIKKTTINGIANKVASFDGEMENADENVRFAVSSLRLKTDDKMYKKLVAEIELSNSYEGWEVHLNIYGKKYQEKKEKEVEE